jgi:hypothetical protein
MAVGGCEKKDLQKLMGSGLSNDISGKVGVGGTSGEVEIACHQVHTHNSAWYSNILRFERISAIENT